VANLNCNRDCGLSQPLILFKYGDLSVNALYVLDQLIDPASEIDVQRSVHQDAYQRDRNECVILRFGHFFFAFQRALAAFAAISDFLFLLSAFARALPPTRPAVRALSARSSGVIDAARSFASSTAAAFFFLVATQSV
jgi:hypothetical protein